MPKPKEPLTLLFCDHCGETKMFPESVVEDKVGKMCGECLNGTMTLAVTINDPGSEL